MEFKLGDRVLISERSKSRFKGMVGEVSASKIKTQPSYGVTVNGEKTYIDHRYLELVRK